MTGLPLAACGDKALYEALKRHLTRRELRCLAMHEGGIDGDVIAAETGLERDAAEAAVHKAHKKLRRPKLLGEFRALLGAPEEDVSSFA